MNGKRGGFTIVELLVVSVLGALVVGATYQVLLTNQRTYTAQNAQIQSQQTVRAGLDVIFAEMRELSRLGTDIQAFASDSLKVRAMRKFGLACIVDQPSRVLTVRKYGRFFQVNDSVVIYAENAVNSMTDDAWIRARVTAVDSTVTCGAEPATRITVNAVGAADFTTAPNIVLPGASLRSYEHYTYGLYTVDGAPYLGRKEAGSSTVTALVGPLRATNGLSFRYLDANNAVTSTLANIAQVEVTLRTLTSVRGPDGRPVADSITTRIYIRN